VAHAAQRYPQLCEAETEVFSRLLGSHVQRLATIAHGDGVCTTFVPASASAAPAAAAPSPAVPAGHGAAPQAAVQAATAKTTAPRIAGRNPA
jgi:hypothetical protein